MGLYQTREMVWEIYSRQRKRQRHQAAKCYVWSMIDWLPSSHNADKLSPESCFFLGCKCSTPASVCRVCPLHSCCSSPFSIALARIQLRQQLGWVAPYATPTMPVKGRSRKMIMQPKYYLKAPLICSHYYSHYKYPSSRQEG